jgi:integrase
MKKLKLPSKPHKGMKIYCHKCKRDNPICNHYDTHKYKVVIHIASGNNKKKTKVLKSKIYADAIIEAINFEKELKTNNYHKVIQVEEGNDYSILGAAVQYQRYLSGNHRYAHKIKKVSLDYQKECMRYCQYFLDNIKEFKNLEQTRIVEVNQGDVARFYQWAENHYEEKTFNKCLNGLRAFFKFLIEIEEVLMKNPFAIYVAKTVIKKDINTLTKEEFILVIDTIGVANPYQTLGGKGEKKNMYRTYLADGFKLFLLTGGRREEVVDLKWSDILITGEGIKFFFIPNKKVNRIRKTEQVQKYNKHIPINQDLFDLLLQLGYNEKKHTTDYILEPTRKVKTKTIMNDLSKSFTHYLKESGINKDVSLKNLRKTYITWVNKAMGKNTGILTSHSGGKVLKDYYIDSSILSTIEEAALKIKIFG